MGAVTNPRTLTRARNERLCLGPPRPFPGECPRGGAGEETQAHTAPQGHAALQPSRNAGLQGRRQDFPFLRARQLRLSPQPVQLGGCLPGRAPGMGQPHPLLPLGRRHWRFPGGPAQRAAVRGAGCSLSLRWDCKAPPHLLVAGSSYKLPHPGD